MSRSEGPLRTFICLGSKGFFTVLNARSKIGSQNLNIMYPSKKIMSLIGVISDYPYPSSFQVPQCYPDHVPTHLALPNHSGHYKQGRPQASTGSEGFGEGHSAGNLSYLFVYIAQPVNRSLLIDHTGFERGVKEAISTFLNAQELFRGLDPSWEIIKSCIFNDWMEIDRLQ